MNRDEAKTKYSYHYIGSEAKGYWKHGEEVMTESAFDERFPMPEIYLNQRENADKTKEWMRKS